MMKSSEWLRSQIGDLAYWIGDVISPKYTPMDKRVIGLLESGEEYTINLALQGVSRCPIKCKLNSSVSYFSNAIQRSFGYLEKEGCQRIVTKKIWLPETIIQWLEQTKILTRFGDEIWHKPLISVLREAQIEVVTDSRLPWQDFAICGCRDWELMPKEAWGQKVVLIAGEAFFSSVDRVMELREEDEMISAL